MTPKLLKLPSLLLAAASLCGLALLVAAVPPAKTGSNIASASAGVAMIPAGDAATVTPVRHGALSMPYFSFARLLRSGS